MLLELKKWFQILVYAIGFVVAALCYLMIRPFIPTDNMSVQIAVILLFLGAINGIPRILITLIPLLATKIWPVLDR